MKALVTGCAGFIGSNLTDYLLKNDYDVIGIDCFSDYYPVGIKKLNIRDALGHENFIFHESNLLEFNKFPEDVDYVFHMAGQAGVRASWGDNFNIFIKNNIEATQRLLEYYKDIELEKFVYSSSSSVYGDVDLPMNEESVLKPISPYGVSKLAAEHLSYLYWKNYDLPTLSLRYFTVYGPRQRPDMAINKFTNAIINGNEIDVYGDGKQTRDFTYVGDVIKANILAAESKFSGEVLNIGGGSRITVFELIENLENIIGNKAVINLQGTQSGDMKNTLADVRKVQKLMKWSPEIRIEEGLVCYIEWLYKGID